MCRHQHRVIKTLFSIIDFHGLLDDVVPYSPEAPNNLGPGPDMTTEARDGHYYTIKRDHLVQVIQLLGCRLIGYSITEHCTGQF